MKILILLFACAIVAMTAATVPVVTPTSLYTQCNYSGSINQQIAGFSTLTSKYAKNIRSLKVGNAAVTIYDDNLCAGNAYNILSDQTCMPSSTDENMVKASANGVSLSVVPPTQVPAAGCISLFKLYCYTGTYRQICGFTPDLKSVFNVAAYGILFGSGVKSIILFNGINYTGESVVLLESTTHTASFYSTKFKSIASIMIVK